MHWLLHVAFLHSIMSSIALKTFIEHVPSVIYWKSLEGRYIMVNQYFLDLLHLQREQVQDHYDHEIHSPAALAVIQRAEQRVLERGQPIIIEEEIELPGGQRCFFSTIFPLFDAQGAISGIGGIATDVTQQRQDQATLRILESAMLHAADSVLITEAGLLDEPGPQIIYVNPAFERMTGYAAAEVLGLNPRLLQGSETDRATTQQIRTALNNKEPICVELNNYRKGGTPFWVEIQIVPIFDQQGTCTHYVSVQRDITERRHFEARRLGLERQLAQAQKLEALGRIASGIAHDFNNLLTIIQVSLGMMREQLLSEHAMHEELDLAERTTQSATDLARQLIALGRDQPQQRRVIDLNDLLVASMPLVRRGIGKRIAITLSLSSAACTVYGDPTQIEQVLLNLCLNGRDAMPNGGMLTIATAVFDDPQRGQSVRWMVSDTGQGIDSLIIERVFEPNFSTKSLGSGLGLFMCYSIIVDHSGTITVVNSPDAGAQFTIELPLV